MRFHVGALAAAAAALLLPGCAQTLSEIRTGPGTSPSPGEIWTPPPGTRLPPATSEPPAAVPPDLLEKAQGWTLTHLVDLALRRNPETRAAWAAARSAAAELGSRRGAYYPTVDLDVGASRTKASAAGGKLVYQQTSYAPVLNIDYLLLDLGGRAASVEEARQALIAADWSHNATIQDVVLAVEQAYYQYVEAKALLEVEQANVKEAEANLDAAEQRHRAGVATIADVLQARRALSEIQLLLQSVEGQIQTMRGALATAVGIPANTPFDVTVPEGDLPLDQVSDDVERMIQEAQTKRPDLAAARSLVAGAESHVAKVRSDGRLSLGLGGQVGRVWYGGDGPQQDTYSASLLLRVPVFSGFSRRYDTLQAQADRDRAQAQLDSLQQQVIYEVWVSYYNLRTAAQRVKTSASLFESASQSEEVSLGRYKAGVGGIIDLLVAQAGLSLARSQQVAARTDWFLSLARLARDTGTLWPPADGPEDAAPSSGEATKGNP
jgi:outer membrane protein